MYHSGGKSVKGKEEKKDYKDDSNYKF